MPEEIPKSFLEELQSLNEPAKRKVLIVTTIVIMIVVTYLWLGYFNGLVAGVSQAPVADNTTQQNPEGSNFWGNLKNGMASIANDFNIFKSSRQYTIEPSK